MKHNFFSLFAFTTLTMASSCHDDFYDNVYEFDHRTLPAYSEEGKGIVAFYYDSTLWRNCGKNPHRTYYGQYLRWSETRAWGENYDLLTLHNMYGTGKTNDLFRVFATTTKVAANEMIYFSSFDLYLNRSSPGEYYIGDEVTVSYYTSKGVAYPANTTDYFRLVIHDAPTGNKPNEKLREYASRNKNRFKVTVKKYNRDSNIASGVFEGYVFNINDPLDSIKISDGRFDVAIDNLN